MCSEVTGLCIRDVAVSVAGSRLGMLSDSRGWYVIRNLPDGDVHLIAGSVGRVQEERVLPMPYRYGTIVVTRRHRPITRVDTVNFYMRIVPMYPQPDSARIRSDHDIVDCKR
jgi:hypothetical protein